MIDILLCGCSGKMGRNVAECVASRSDCRITAGVDAASVSDCPFPVFQSPAAFSGRADVIIDFSHPSALGGLLEYAVANGTPAVICTTGLNEAQQNLIKKAATKIPVFFSANMSIGVVLVRELSKTAARILGGDFDIEIVEKHHNQKLDAPSGTALMLADAISSALPEQPEYEYNRHAKREKRPKNEIGIHSVRGGTIVGEHDVIFAGHDEVVTISHSAGSRQIFAAGAVSAALFIAGKSAGLYEMNDIVSQGGQA